MVVEQKQVPPSERLFKGYRFVPLFFFACLFLFIAVNQLLIRDWLSQVISLSAQTRIVDLADFILPYLYFPVVALLVLSMLEKDLVVSMITLVSSVMLYARTFMIHDQLATWITLAIIGVTVIWATILEIRKKPLERSMPSLSNDKMKTMIQQAAILVVITIVLNLYISNSFPNSSSANKLLALLTAAPTLFLLVRYYGETFVSQRLKAPNSNL